MRMMTFSFMKHAFNEAHITNPLHVATDCAQAIQYLAGEGKFSDRAKFPLPALVLLDLKLPDKSGLEVLRGGCGG